MRDAIGGLVNIVIIVVFLVIVSGYLAFNVNYTKAFRVKNKIITTYEQYEGNCDNDSSACMQQITEYMQQIGYDMNNTPNISGYNCRRGFCVKRVDSKSTTGGIADNDQYYFKIVTQITIDIPIIKKVMAGMNVFQVSGDTKSFKVRVKN